MIDIQQTTQLDNLQKAQPAKKLSPGQKFALFSLISLFFICFMGLNKTGISSCLSTLDLDGEDTCLFLGVSAWEWVKLLIGPLILAIIGYVYDARVKDIEKSRKKREDDLEKNRLARESKKVDEQRQEKLLSEYLEKINSLILLDQWPQSEEKKWEQEFYAVKANNIDANSGLSEQQKKLNTQIDLNKIIQIVQGLTMRVLKQVNGERKGFIISYLCVNNAIKHINLSGANLSKADLSYLDLSNVNLNVADLGGAELRFSILTETMLNGANLYQADIRGADLRRTKLEKAILLEAKVNKEQILSSENFESAFLDKNKCDDWGIQYNSTDDFIRQYEANLNRLEGGQFS